MGLESGDTLQGGQYTIERLLLTGTNSLSYLATRKDGERWVIKVLDPLLLVGESDYERDRIETLFIQEAMKLRDCKNPHIARAERPFKEQGLICVPVEYVSGVSLAERSQLVLPEAEALNYIRQIGEALAVVHSQNLVHRDIRPSNIFVRMSNGEAVLANFDLAVDSEKELTMVRTHERKDGFSPIELYVPGKRLRPCTDVYALAATLYVLLTGEVPASVDERTDDPRNFVLPKGKNPEITDATAAAIVSGMALLPEDRPETAAKWLAECESTVEDLPDVGERSSINVPKWSMIWGAVAAIATVVSALAAIWIGVIKEPNPAVIEPAVQESPKIPKASSSEQEPDSNP